MKYYIYISDTKVDMLFPQVPHDIKKKVALEFKMDLKILSASRKTESETEDNRIARLETVVDFIRQYGNVGSVDNPDEYIADCLTMRWGDYGWSDWRPGHLLEDSPVVYFGGVTEKTIVGLGGSMKHLLGSNVESHASSYSATPFLMAYLARHLQFRVPGHYTLHSYEENLPWPEIASVVGRELPEFTLFLAVELATTEMEGPQQRVEFLAKRLASGPVTKWCAGVGENSSLQNVLLATPIYVALGD
jgi:hypothetical protein